MPWVKAAIYDVDKVLFDNLDVWVEVIQEGALKSWHGSFSISDVKFIEPGGPFRLVASDGRRGEILISRVSAGSHQNTHVSFVGSGSFA